MSTARKAYTKTDKAKQEWKAKQKKGYNTWYTSQTPFNLIKDGIEYGPYQIQREALDDPMINLSSVSLSNLCTGVKTQVKGFQMSSTHPKSGSATIATALARFSTCFEV